MGTYLVQERTKTQKQIQNRNRPYMGEVVVTRVKGPLETNQTETNLQ